MAIGTDAPAPTRSPRDASAPASRSLSRSARLDLIATSALALGGLVATIVVVVAIAQS
ncbi:MULTISPECIES: hypothetical protein [unclassified Salinibacterium]|uniref:hypothetical protein n=1 Tax=unclassified Salinibacterium TaxID=2632331 RepID=UPI00143D9756|nr:MULTISPECIES: hypothetical protein [unclassified Salinibacterium]